MRPRGGLGLGAGLGECRPHGARTEPYLATLIGDTFPVGSIGGILNDVLHQPKYADEVYKLLLLVD